jgi:outer membrane protein assembly factor BamB
LIIESSSGIKAGSGKTAVRYLLAGYPVYGGSAASTGPLVYLAGSRTYRAKAGGFYGFDAATGKLLWKYERANLAGSTLIVSEGRVYGLGSDDFLYCFIPESPQPNYQVAGRQSKRARHHNKPFSRNQGVNSR